MVLGSTYPLEHLLSPDILQSAIQILNPLDDIVNLPLVRALNCACLANRQIQSQLDPTACLMVRRQPFRSARCR